MAILWIGIRLNRHEYSASPYHSWAKKESFKFVLGHFLHRDWEQLLVSQFRLTFIITENPSVFLVINLLQASSRQPGNYTFRNCVKMFEKWLSVIPKFSHIYTWLTLQFMKEILTLHISLTRAFSPSPSSSDTSSESRDFSRICSWTSSTFIAFFTGSGLKPIS